ncbi:hypothetical protein V499_07861 [Pseudogymnoascus sp. VKM F-103]|nr:hypothetical protein V499_07861 [Pseudogymnoascus sp. VKM F-103]
MGALSKGCESCKRKKVKCDETRPLCNRCRKAGIECPGYNRRLRFVDETPRIERSIATAHVQFHEFAEATRNSHLASPSSRISRPPRLNPATLVTNTLPLTAFKDDIFISYLYSKLFDSNALGDRCGLPADWVLELANNPQKSRYKSWDALAAIVFGQAHQCKDVILTSKELYQQALSELRCVLSNASDRCTDSTVASMTALCKYDRLLSATGGYWVLHVDGLKALLESRGPWQQKSYASKTIFLEHRIMLVTEAIITSRSTFLRCPLWKTVPWEDDPASKSPIDYLVDIGADITEYIAQAKIFNSKCNQGAENTNLKFQVASSLEELNTWWHHWEAEQTEPASELTSHQDTNESIFHTLLEYDTLWTAFTVCYYDAIRILLLQLWYILRPFPGPKIILDEPNRTALLGITSNSERLAREILRSLKYCYRKSQRFIYTSSFLFIQDVAYGCFYQGSKEAAWAGRHSWAELGSFDNIEEANILRKLLPLGNLKARN